MPKTGAPRKRRRIGPNNAHQTNPKVVTKPVAKFVHPKLKKGWKIHSLHQMCYIFDAVTPGRQWKRGTVYTEAEPWATYGDDPWADLTETDPDDKYQPYYPRKFE